MVSLEVVAILLSGISISASLFYYANVLQNANKTRQAQLYMGLLNTFRSARAQPQYVAAEYPDLCVVAIDDLDALLLEVVLQPHELDPVLAVDVGGEQVEGGLEEQGKVWAHHHKSPV